MTKFLTVGSDGNEYTVERIELNPDSATRGGSKPFTDNIKYQTTSGLEVVIAPQGKYRIKKSGITLTPKKPNIQ